MNIDQYKLLCDACDNVINKDKNLYKVSIPWLHVIREHPVSLKQYELLFKGSFNDDPSYSNNSLLVNRKPLNIFPLEDYQLANSINHKDVDVVIVSHLVNTDHLNCNEDFYFADIPKYLVDNKINPLVILINHTNEKTENLSKLINHLETPRIILSKNLNLKGEVQNVFGLIKEMIKMRFSSFKEEGLLKQVLQRSSSVKGLGGALSALRIGRQVEEVLSLCNPKAIMTTYEGHSWERVVYRITNQHNDNILRIGYQHSVITKNAHSIVRPLGKKYDPDLIFTSGEITNNFFQKSLKKSHSKLLVLGSKKSLEKLDSYSDKQSKICLVLPEGIIEECDTLFSFSIKCANALPRIDFIWRLHPVMSFNKVLEHMSINMEDLPKNIIISSSSLSEDIVKSSFALYRGTTAIIEAVYGGLTPIYLSDESGMTIDLLHEMDEGRKIVRNIEDFTMVVDDVTPHNNDKLTHYCKRYFMPFDYSILLKELRGVI